MRNSKIHSSFHPKSRYPGLIPFKEDQGNLFFGRDREVKELYNLMLAETTVVLFAKSGVGKSSLLHAGLFPKLKENGYYPIKVRFKEAADQRIDEPVNEEEPVTTRLTPLQILVDILEKESAGENSLLNLNRDNILYNKEAPRLWELFKATTIRRPILQSVTLEEETDNLIQVQARQSEGGSTSILGEPKTLPRTASPQDMVPVLVFDQFEEFFHWPYGERHEFLCELAELLHTLTPNRISEWLRNTKMSERSREMINWAKPPMVKCIFAIRDDKLSEIDQLRAYIPLIMRSRYKLSPLNYVNAREAIERPARQNGDFSVMPFSFDVTIINNILLQLSGRNQAVANASEHDNPVDQLTVPAMQISGIDGSQLQQVATYIEQLVWKAGGARREVFVDGTLINPEKDVQLILDNYYEGQLLKLGSRSDIIVCRNIIENHLVAGGARASITAGQMNALLKDKRYFFARKREDYLVARMIDTRLIKEEYTHLGRTFELSHDTLVNSVMKYASENRIRTLTKQKAAYIGLFGLSLLFLAASIFLAYRLYKSSNTTNLKLADSYYQQGNHYLAFNIWDNYAGGPIATGGNRANIRRLLDSLTFFDIGGGDRMEFISDSLVAVHEKDNTIYLWKLQPDNRSLLTEAIFPDAYNLEVSGSQRYLGYWSQQSDLVVYDLRNKQSFVIDEARQVYTPTQQSPGRSEEKDFKMGFLPGGDFIGYIDRKGYLHLYDLARRQSVELPMPPLKKDTYIAGVMKEFVKICPDKQHIAVNIGESLFVWKIGQSDLLAKPWKDTVYYTFLAGESTGVHYLKGDTLYALTFNDDTVGTRPVSSFKPGIMPVISSPDGMHLAFYNESDQLTVYNTVTGQLTVTSQKLLFSPGDPPNFRYTTRLFNWDSDTKLVFEDNKGVFKTYNLPDGRITINNPASKNYQVDNAYFNIVADSAGCLSVTDRTTHVLVWEDTLQAMEPNETSRADIWGGDSNGHLVAYVRVNDKGQPFLKVVDLLNKSALLEVKGQYEVVNLHGNKVTVMDIYNNQGCFLLNGIRNRDKHYYRALYPELSKAQKKRLGLTIL